MSDFIPFKLEDKDGNELLFVDPNNGAIYLGGRTNGIRIEAGGVMSSIGSGTIPGGTAQIPQEVLDDIAGKVDKEIGKSLFPDSAVSGLHAPGSDNQDLSGLVVKETGRSLVADTEIGKIHANTLDHNHLNKTTLDSVQEALTTALKTSYDSAVTHAGSAHAPSNAQKNSDITKAEIEAKLIGEISTHTHAGGGGNIAEFAINVQALTSSPTDSQTVYFGMLPKAPTTTANISKIYIRKACTLKVAEIYCYSGTAGTNEAWSLYVRKNNSADTLIATLGVSASERVFSNVGLNISLVAGDYLEIKGVQPLWATNPATCIYAGYLYFE